MQRSSVDLPEPEGPMMQITSPFCTSIDTPFSTSTSPNDLCTSRTLTSGSGLAREEAFIQWSTAYLASRRTVQRAIG